MKALTIIEPWASLIVYGAKRYETRSWSTKYRGPLAVHGGARRVLMRLGSGIIGSTAHDGINAQAIRTRQVLVRGVWAFCVVGHCQLRIGNCQLAIGNAFVGR